MTSGGRSLRVVPTWNPSSIVEFHDTDQLSVRELKRKISKDLGIHPTRQVLRSGKTVLADESELKAASHSVLGVSALTDDGHFVLSAEAAEDKSMKSPLQLQKVIRLLLLPCLGGTTRSQFPESQWTSAVGSLGGNVETVRVDYPGHSLGGDASELHDNVDSLTDFIIKEHLSGSLAKEPWAIFGHSMGALVGYELARKMEQKGNPPLCHFAAASEPPIGYISEFPASETDEELMARLHRLGGVSKEIHDDRDMWGLLLPMVKADRKLENDYKHSPLPALQAPLFVLCADNDPSLPEKRARDWVPLTDSGICDFIMFPGGHFFHHDEANLPKLFDYVREKLEQATKHAAGLEMLDGSVEVQATVAAQDIHWCVGSDNQKAWLSLAPGCTGTTSTWRGWAQAKEATTWSPAVQTEDIKWRPWQEALDEKDAPFFRWFSGALTNAAFNEMDRHVLSGHGQDTAYIVEPADAAETGRKLIWSYADLMIASSLRASVLAGQEVGLKQWDRVIFVMSNTMEQCLWIEACKRLGVVYSCCAPGVSADVVAERAGDLQPKLIISLCGVAEATARNALQLVTEGGMCEGKIGLLLLGSQGAALEDAHDADKLLASKREELGWSEAGPTSKDMTPSQFVAEVWKVSPCVAIEANSPMFVTYTSGSTGKPKGIVHCPAYIVGPCRTMREVFAARPGADRILTIGNPGWITGQSYQIAGPLTARITAIWLEGSPTRPSTTRFAEVIRKHKVTILKAGSTFLREVISSEKAVKELEDQYGDLPQQLRIGTFCAEPVSSAVQQFAMDHLCKTYINSYWASEHGGMVFSRLYGNDAEQPLAPNAHTWPLPWVKGDVYMLEDGEASVLKGQVVDDDKADIVIKRPYPYLFRTVWGDCANVGKDSWRGNASMVLARYWRKVVLAEGSEPEWVYIQGDYAQKWEHATNEDVVPFTFHGRSDEVIKVNGILFGTEQLEGAVSRDRSMENSPLGDVVVVGSPHPLHGEVPVAFVIPSKAGLVPTEEDMARWAGLVVKHVYAIPVFFIPVADLPRTSSGKFMRRMLRALLRKESLGDTSTLLNPDCLDGIAKAVELWRAQQEGDGPKATEPDTESSQWHPLLAPTLASSPKASAVFSAVFPTPAREVYQDHVAFDVPILPGASHIALMSAGILRTTADPENSWADLTDITFAKPMPLDGTDVVECCLLKDGTAEVRSMAQGQEAAERLHAQCGGFKLRPKAEWNFKPGFADEGMGEAWDIKEYFQDFAQRGLKYGPNFQFVTAGRGAVPGQKPVQAVGTLHPWKANPTCLLHPALLDGAVQVAMMTFWKGVKEEGLASSWLPFSVRRAALKMLPKKETELKVFASVAEFSERMFRTDVYVTAEGGEVVAVLEGLTCVPANADSLAGALATLDQKEEESTDVGTGQVAVIRSSQDLAPLLQETAASLLPGGGEEPLPDEVPLFSLGVTSLLAVELRGRLQKQLGMKLPSTLVFDYPTLKDIGGAVFGLIDQSKSNTGAEVENVIDAPEVEFVRRPEEEWDSVEGTSPLYILSAIQSSYYLAEQRLTGLDGRAAHYYWEVELPQAPGGLHWNPEILSAAMRQVVRQTHMMRSYLDNAPEMSIGVGWRTLGPKSRQIEEYKVHVGDVPVASSDNPEEHRKFWEKLRSDMPAKETTLGAWPCWELQVHRDAGGDVASFVTPYYLFSGRDFTLVVQQWVELLHAAGTGDVPVPLKAPDAPLPVTPQEYLHYLDAFQADPRYLQAKIYWEGRLDDLPPAPKLPLMRPLVDAPDYSVGTLWRDVGVETEKLLAACRRQRLQVSTTFLAAYGAILTRYSGATRFTLNLLTSWRPNWLPPQLMDLLGQFSRTVLFVVDLRKDDTWKSFVQRLQAEIMDCIENAAFDGLDVLQLLNNRDRDVSARFPIATIGDIRFPGFDDMDSTFMHDTVKGWQGAHDTFESPITKPKVRKYVPETGHIILDNGFMSAGGKDSIEYMFAQGVMDDRIVEAMINEHCRILRALTEDDTLWQQPVHAFPDLIVPGPRNLPPLDVPKAWLFEPFVAEAAAHPERPAVTGVSSDPAVEDLRLSYGELLSLVVNFCREIRSTGSTARLVGIVMVKGWEQVVAALAITAAQRAYLPVLGDYPPERIRQVLELGEVAVVATQPAFESGGNWQDAFKVLVVRRPDPISLTAAEAQVLALELRPPRSQPDHGELAYVIFTSGSTGKPKGVMLNHTGPLNTCLDCNGNFEIGPSSVALAISELNFDLSVWDIFGVLGAGGSIVMPAPGTTRDPSVLVGHVEKYGITHWNSVPQFAQMTCDFLDFTDQDVAKQMKTLTCLMMSGDKIPKDLVRQANNLIPHTRLVSMGGATEASIWSVLYDIPTADKLPDIQGIPYGRGMRNQPCDIRDLETLDHCPHFVTGEVILSGIGLALGYWRRPDLTGNAFVIDPWSKERMYLAGDLGRWLPMGEDPKGGEMEFLGRKDFQVKIHGFRVELGEIEAVVLSTEGVKDAVAHVIEGQLFCYITTHTGDDSPAKPAEAACTKRLPHYMVPQCVYLEKVPLSANGKVDRSKLPRPVAGKKAVTTTESSRPAKQSKPKGRVKALARIVRGIFAGVLPALNEASQVNPDTNFFEMGGNSILAVRIVGLINRQFQSKIGVLTMRDKGTVNMLAAELDSAGVTVELEDGDDDESEDEVMEGELPVAKPLSLQLVGISMALAGGKSHSWLPGAGLDGCIEMPLARWDVNLYCGSEPGTSGSLAYTKHANFIDGAELFDSPFFGIPVMEAKAMDPQQRLLLEESVNSLNVAGVLKKGLTSLKDTSVGVFCGQAQYDWSKMRLPMTTGPFQGTGNHPSISSNRISFTLGFKGPSMTVDTACSSGLVAVRLATQNSKQCPLTLAASANLMLDPSVFVAFCKAGMLSPDGRCKTFDAKADGYGRGEGVCAMALAVRDHIESADVTCTLRGIGINQDGRSVSLTAPNGPSQREVLTMAMEEAKLTSDSLVFSETHGTGTPLGDPIEVGAIAGVRDGCKEVLMLAAAKTNIGHLEGAAGLAGLIRCERLLRPQVVPANLHLKELNMHLGTVEDGMDRIGFTTETTTLPQGKDARCAANVSSFGFGGTNAHAVLMRTAKTTKSKWPDLNVTSMQWNKQALPWTELPHPMLTQKEMLPGNEGILFRCTAEGTLLKLLFDYAVGGKTAVSHMALLELALAAAREALKTESWGLSNVSFTSMPALPAEGSDQKLVLECAVRAKKVEICSVAEDGSTSTHLEALVEASPVMPEDTEPYPKDVLGSVGAKEAATKLYAKLASDGETCGSHFRAVRRLSLTDTGSAVAAMDVERDATQFGYMFHPALLEGMVQACALAGVNAECANGGSVAAVVPREIARVLISEPKAMRMPYGAQSAWSVRFGEAQSLRKGVVQFNSALLLGDASYTGVHARMEGIECEFVAKDDFARNLSVEVAEDQRCTYDVAWEPAEMPSPTPLATDVAVHSAAIPTAAGTQAQPLEALGTLLDLVQEKANSGSRVAVLTSGVDGPVLPGSDLASHAGLSAFARTARLEVAALGLTCIDVGLDAQIPSESWGAWIQSPEQEVALRGEQAFVRRITRSKLLPHVTLLPEGESQKCLKDATVVVTGASGALGGVVCDWLLEQGVARLVALSRSGSLPPCSKAEGKVDAMKCDVSDASAVAAVAAGLQDTPCSVFHLSGVLADASVLKMTREDLNTVWRPKVQGAQNLIDAFVMKSSSTSAQGHLVMFSSAAALLGNPGQANYAAANACLDGLAQQLRASGKHPKATSIQWGPWRDVGMATSDAVRKHLEMQGYKSLPNELALAGLREAISTSVPPALGMLGVVWPKFAKANRYPPALARFSGKVPSAQEQKPASTTEKAYDVDMLVKMAVNAAVEVIDESMTLEADWPLMDAGLDSLSAMALRDNLADLFGSDIKLPATLVFDYPTAREIALFAAEQVCPEATTESIDAYPSDATEVAKWKPTLAGAACCFPGSGDALLPSWASLTAGVDGMLEIPLSRWNIEDHYDADQSKRGKTYAIHGAFIEGIDSFDYKHFRLTRPEGEQMDPQQRKMMEVGYAALYRAGERQSTVVNQKGFIVVGQCANDWQYITASDIFSPHLATGVDMAITAARLSFVLSMRGPCFTVDTACSSGLVALESGFRSMAVRDGPEFGIAGATQANLTHHRYVLACRGGMLTPDGRCKTFDTSADGYARGEGAGATVLAKNPTSSALPITLSGNSINQDGKSASITAPHGPSQQTCIGAALREAGIDLPGYSCMETHGTGTSLGDAVELGAFKNLLSKHGGSKSPILLSAVKTNVGHLEGPAGTIGLNRLLTSLLMGMVAPNVHLRQLNPEAFGRGDVRKNADEPQAIAATLTEMTRMLPADAKSGGVSSFGFGGTNSHTLITVQAKTGLSPRHVLDNTSPQAGEQPLKMTRRPLPWKDAKHSWNVLLRGVRFTDHIVTLACPLRKEVLAILKDHVIDNICLAPGTLYMETMLAALSAHTGMTRIGAKDLGFLFPLFIDVDKDEKEQQCLHLRFDQARGLVEIGSGPAGSSAAKGVPHFEATLVQASALKPQWDAVAKAIAARGDQLRSSGVKPRTTNKPFYEHTWQSGSQFRPRFATVREVWDTPDSGDKAVTAWLAPEKDWTNHGWHFNPAVMDGGFQLLTNFVDDLRLPFRIGELTAEVGAAEPGEGVWADFEASAVEAKDMHYRLSYATAAGKPVLALTGCHWRTAEIGKLAGMKAKQTPKEDAFMFTTTWKDMEVQDTDAPAKLLQCVPAEMPNDKPTQPLDVLEEALRELYPNTSKPQDDDEPAPARAGLHLWVTGGAQLVGDQSSALEGALGAGLLGLARTARHEALATSTIVVADVLSCPVAKAGFVVPESKLPVGSFFGEEREVALRDGRLKVPRLAVAPEAPSKKKEDWPWHAGGSCVLTGGTGALGQVVADWLIKEGAKKVVLLSRSGAASAKSGSITAEKCDVSDVNQVKSLATRLGGAPACVMHLAGVLADNNASKLTRACLEKCWNPKVNGALNLREVFGADVPLVFFSSVTALWGNAGQASYGAANAVLDALAQSWSLQSPGKVCSVQWGPWGEVGMAAEAGVLKRMAKRGIGALTNAMGMEALSCALRLKETPVLAANPIFWDQFQKLYAKPFLSFYSDWAPKKPAKRSVHKVEATKPAAAQAAQPVDLYVREVVKAVLDFPDLQDDTDLSDEGLDSLQALEVRNRLREKLPGTALSVSNIFDHPTVSMLAKFLGGQVAPAAAPIAVAVAAPQIGQDLARTVRDIVCAVLDAPDLGDDEDLADEGLDSLQALEVRNRIREKVPGSSLSVAQIFDHPTIGKLSQCLGGQVQIAAPSPVAETAVTSSSPIAVVRKVVQSVLDASDITDDADLADEGLDSLQALEVRNRLREELPGSSLSVSTIFDHPTISQLAAHLAGVMNVPAAAPTPAAVPVSNSSPIELVRKVVQSVLDASDITDDADLADEGLDSLQALEVRNRLREGLPGATLAVSHIFDNPTIEKLAGYLAATTTAVAPGTAAPAPAAVLSGTNAPIELVRKVVQSVLDASDITDDADLADEGLDSLQALEVRNRLREGLPGATLAVSHIFDNPTIAKLAGYLASTVPAAAAPATPATAAPVASSHIAAVRKVVQAVLDTSDITDDADLADEGLDSLQALEVRNRLREEVPGLALAVSNIFDHPTISQLTGYLASVLPAPAAPVAPTAVVSPSPAAPAPPAAPAAKRPYPYSLYKSSPYCWSEHRVLVGPGVDLYAVEAGARDAPNGTLLLLGGACETSHTAFSEQIVDLPKLGFHVIAWDPRGYGFSRPPHAPARDMPVGEFYQRDAMDAAALMAKLGLPKYAVLGWSDGANTANHLAAMRPQCVTKLLQWGGTAYINDEDAKIFAEISFTDGDLEGEDHLIEVYGKQELRQLWRTLGEGTVGYNKQGVKMVEDSVLESIQCPTLVLHGMQDSQVRAEHPYHFASKIKGSAVHVFPTASHFLHVTHPKDFLNVAARFLLAPDTLNPAAWWTCEMPKKIRTPQQDGKALDGTLHSVKAQASIIAAKPATQPALAVTKKATKSGAPNRIQMDWERVAYSFFSSVSMFAAIEMDIFENVAAGITTIEELQKACACEFPRLQTLLNALCAENLMKRSPDGIYSLPRPITKYLTKKSDSYYGDMLIRQYANQWYPKMAGFTHIMKTGETPDYKEWFSNPEEADMYTQGQWNGSFASAGMLQNYVDFSKVTHVLDIGGGPGAFAVRLAMDFPHLSVTILEFHTVADSGEKVIAREAPEIWASGRVKYARGSCIEPWPKELDGLKADVAFLSYVSESVPAHTLPELYKNAYDHLNENGVFLAHSFMVDDTLDGPINAAMHCLEHIAVSPEGAGLCPKYVEEIMTSVGYEYTDRHEVIRGLTKMVVGHKKWEGREKSLAFEPEASGTSSGAKGQMEWERVAYGFFSSVALFAAIDMDVFEHIDAGIRTIEGLKKACNCEKPRLQTMITALCSEKMIKRSPAGEYTLPRVVAKYLTKKSDYYYGDMLLWQYQKQWYPKMARFSSIMKTGQTPDYKEWFSNPEEANAYTQGQWNGSFKSADMLQNYVDFSKVKHVLDIGGGPGAFAVRLAKDFPNLSVTILEFHTVADAGEKIIAREAPEIWASGRVKYARGSCIEPWPKELDGLQADVAFLSYVSESVPAHTLPELYTNAHQRLKENGVFLVHSFMVDDTLDGPINAALHCVEHIAVSPQGAGLCPKYVEDILRRVGYEHTDRHEVIRGLTKMVVGHKRWQGRDKSLAKEPEGQIVNVLKLLGA